MEDFISILLILCGMANILYRARLLSENASNKINKCHDEMHDSAQNEAEYNDQEVKRQMYNKEKAGTKILIIGVGDGATNAVKHMKKVGIPNANYITFGCYRYEESDIPHYNLITMNGLDYIPAGSGSKEFQKLAETAEDYIGEIIEYHLNSDNNN